MKKSFTLLAMLFLLSTSAFGQFVFDLTSVGARLAYVVPDVDGLDNVIGFEGIANVGTFGENIELEAGILYWSKSESATSIGVQAESSFRDLAFLANGHYLFTITNEKLKPYAVAGIGLHMYKTEVKVSGGGIFSGGSTSLTSTKLGIRVGGGTTYEISETLDFTGEISYNIISDISQFLIEAGISYKLGQ